MKFVLMLVQDARSWDEEPQAEKDRVYNEHVGLVGGPMG